MRRYELSDKQWARIASFFQDPTHHDGRGRRWNDHRMVLNGILWALHTGAPWRDLPERYGPWQTVHNRFRLWTRDGTWTKILDALLAEQDRRGRIGRDLWLVDTTVIRASRAAAGAKKKAGPAPPAGRAKGDATGRATRPCAGAFAGRLWHQGASGL
jgi:transposase